MAEPRDATPIARAAARAFLARYGSDVGQRLEEIAPQIGLTVVEADAHSFDGALLRVLGARAGTVVLRRDIAEAGRKRFTLAHEIGHYVLPNQQTQLSPCQEGQVESWSGKLSQQEAEANCFAAEVLVPEALLESRERIGQGLELARHVAGRFRVSLTAAALRLAETTSERIAVVLSRDGVVEWCRRSAEFGCWVRDGALDPRSLAYDHARGLPAPETEPVVAAAWLDDGKLKAGAKIVEWSVAMPSYGRVLTMLHIPERIELHDEDEDPKEPLDPDEFTTRRQVWPR